MVKLIEAKNKKDLKEEVKKETEALMKIGFKVNVVAEGCAATIIFALPRWASEY